MREYQKPVARFILEEHFQKALMKLRKISITLAAVEADFAKNLRVVALLGEAVVFVLNIAGCQNHSISDFKKFLVITAIRADDSHVPAGMNLFAIHDHLKILHEKNELELS
ncbi:MAG: hypothetical protein P8130_05775 [Deltaproteobacteria bacterium]